MAGAINRTLDALADGLRFALPLNVTVHAPEKTLGPLALYPVVQVYPWKLSLERTATGMWGTVLREGTHPHGADLYRFALLELPLTPVSDQETARRSLQIHVDQIRAGLAAAPTLPDDLGRARVLDAADHMQADYGGQGAIVEWHRRPYMGAYLTIAVQPLWRSANG